MNPEHIKGMESAIRMECLKIMLKDVDSLNFCDDNMHYIMLNKANELSNFVINGIVPEIK